jgi:hypothetical protein
VIQPPLAGLLLSFVSLDPLGQHAGLHMRDHVEDIQRMAEGALLKLVPVGLVENGLRRDQVLAGELGDLVRHDGDERPPRRQILEVAELVIAQVLHQDVTHQLRVNRWLFGISGTSSFAVVVLPAPKVPLIQMIISFPFTVSRDGDCRGSKDASPTSTEAGLG